MPRCARKMAASGVYHVVVRGLDHQNIFEKRKDYVKYLDLLRFYKKKLGFELFAFCLMSNHVHLVIFVKDEPLEKIFRCLNTSYAWWFNTEYERTGPVQQGRYYSEPVEDLVYLRRVIRYVHRNPMKAGLELCPGESYKWSSFREFAAGKSKLVNVAFVLDLYGGREEFLQFQMASYENPSEDDCLDVDRIRKRIPDHVAREMIFAETRCDSTADFLALPKTERARGIRALHEMGLSIRQLNRLTGVSKGLIEQILSESEKE